MGRLRASSSGQSLDGAWSAGVGEKTVGGNGEEGENIQVLVKVGGGSELVGD